MARKKHTRRAQRQLVKVENVYPAAIGCALSWLRPELNMRMSFTLSAAQGAAVIVRVKGGGVGGGETQLLQDNLMCSKDF